MTSRTHDLFALTAVTFVVCAGVFPQMNVATAVVSGFAVFLGSMAPDMDEPAAEFWRRFPAGSGSILSRIIAPVFGSHRFISHSLLGIGIFGYLLLQLLLWMSTFVLVDMYVVWSAFMLGFISHIGSDMLTREGVPLFFPFPLKIGIPPIKALRLKTGGMIEKTIVFPGLLLLNAYLLMQNKNLLFQVLKDILAH